MTSKSFEDLRSDLYRRSPKSKKRVADQVAELTEQLGLADLRARRSQTQVELAKAIGTTQSAVSRMERQDDLLVSSLSDYVAATGGQLRLVAQYDDYEIEIGLPAILQSGSRSSPRTF